MTPVSRIVWPVLLAALAFFPGVSAQDKKHEAQLRAVHGTVLDKSENPLSGGIVFLKNMRTKGVTTHITGEDGNYRFSGLDPNVDYEIHAEKEGPQRGLRDSRRKRRHHFDHKNGFQLRLAQRHRPQPET